MMVFICDFCNARINLNVVHGEITRSGDSMVAYGHAMPPADDPWLACETCLVKIGRIRFSPDEVKDRAELIQGQSEFINRLRGLYYPADEQGLRDLRNEVTDLIKDLRELFVTSETFGVKMRMEGK